MGRCWLDPDSRNPVGYYEDTRIGRLNHKILGLAGGSFCRPPSIEKLMAVDKMMDVGREIRHIIEALRAESPDTFSVGFKDPKTALTIHLIAQYIPDPRFVVCYRDPNQVVESLRKFDHWSEAEKQGVELLEVVRIHNELSAALMQ